MGNTERRVPLGRPRRRLENNIKIVLQKMGLGGEGAWTGSICLRIGGGSINCGEFSERLRTG